MYIIWQTCLDLTSTGLLRLSVHSQYVGAIDASLQVRSARVTSNRLTPRRPRAIRSLSSYGLPISRRRRIVSWTSNSVVSWCALLLKVFIFWTCRRLKDCGIAMNISGRFSSYQPILVFARVRPKRSPWSENSTTAVFSRLPESYRERKNRSSSSSMWAASFMSSCVNAEKKLKAKSGRRWGLDVELAAVVICTTSRTCMTQPTSRVIAAGLRHGEAQVWHELVYKCATSSKIVFFNTTWKLYLK